MNLGALIATLGVDTSGLARAELRMRQFETNTRASIKRINATLKTQGDAMKNVGRSMSMYITLPLTLAGGASFKMYKDFEANMSKVTGLVGVARKQVEAWKQDILDLAPAVARGPKELSDALYFITSAGIRGAEAMEVLEMSAKAAAAGLGETKVVADLVTSAMNAYGSEVLSAQEATEALVATVREGKAAPEELASSMGMVLPIASQMSVSFQEVGASIAAMSRTGTNAQTAAIQLRQILASLLKPSQQAEMALRDMGTSAEEMRDIIRSQGMLQGLMKIRELTNKYGEDVAAKVFPNIRALSGILDIIGNNIEDNVKIFKALEDNTGDLAAAFAAASETADFRLNAAMTKMQVSAVRIGEAVSQSLIPVFEKLGDMLESIGNWFSSLDSVQQRLIITIGGVVAAIGPLLAILGVIVGSVIPAMVTGIGALTTAFHALTAAIMTNPIGALLVAGTALISVLIGIKNRTRDVADEFRYMATIQDKISQSTESEKAELNKLLNVLKSETTTRNQKLAAIKKLNQLSPEYLGNLTEETALTREGQIAIDAYVSSLENKVRVQALQELLVEEEKKRLRELAEGQDRELTGWQMAGAAFKNYFGIRINSQKLLQKSEENAQKSLEAYEARINNLINLTNDTTKTQEDLTKQFKFVRQEMEALSGTEITIGNQDQVQNIQKRITEQIKAEKDYTEMLNSELEKRYKEDEQLTSLRLRYTQYANQQGMQETAAMYAQEITARKKVIAEDLQLVMSANQERIKILEDYQDTAETYANKINKLLDSGKETTTRNAAIEETIKAYRKQISVIENMEVISKSLGEEFDGTSAKIEVARATIQSFSEAGVTSHEVLTEIGEDLKAFNEKATRTEIMKGYADSMAYVTNQAKLFGNEINLTDAFLEIVTNTLNEFASANITAGLEVDSLVDKLKELQEYKKIEVQMDLDLKDIEKEVNFDTEQFQTAGSIFEDMEKQMNQATNSANMLGETFPLVSTQIGILEEAMKKAQEHKGLWTVEDLEMYDEVIAKLKELGYNFEQTGEQTLNWGAFIENTFQGMSNVITNALNSTENGLQAFWKFFVDWIKGMIIKLVAATIAALAFAAALSVIGVGPGLAKGIQGLKEGMKFGELFKLGLTKFGGFKKGGVVPGGYPDDKFPAMLTSGEIVVPVQATTSVERLLEFVQSVKPNIDREQGVMKLASGGLVGPTHPSMSIPAPVFDSGSYIERGGSTVDVNVTVEGIQRGQDIYYVVKEVERRLNNAN